MAARKKDQLNKASAKEMLARSALSASTLAINAYRKDKSSPFVYADALMKIMDKRSRIAYNLSANAEDRANLVK